MMVKQPVSIFFGVFGGLAFCALLMGASTKTTTPKNIKLITPGASVLSPIPRSLYIAATGTVSITNADGTTMAAIPVVAGTELRCQPQKVTAATATVYAYYD